MTKGNTDFERQAEEASPGTIRELLNYLRHSGKWWLAPVFLALLVIGLLIVLGQTAVAPFIYTLF
jgi:hypothetical protein